MRDENKLEDLEKVVEVFNVFVERIKIIVDVNLQLWLYIMYLYIMLLGF